MTTLIKFSAPWCNPCKQIEPLIAAEAGELDDVIFMDVDIDENPEAVAEWGLRAVPTLVLLSPEGVEVDRESGLQAKRLIAA